MSDESSQRWTLPAPESQVLLTGPETPNSWVIKLALKELVLRRVLSVRTLRTRRFLVLWREINVFVSGQRPNAPVSPPLSAVVSVFPKPTPFSDGSTGVPVKSAASEVMRWYRAGGGLVEAEVMPELRRQGLYDLPADAGGPRWRLTPQGEQELARLRQLMATGRTSFPEWVERDRSRAAEFISLSGPAALLLGNPTPWIWAYLMQTLNRDGSPVLPALDPFADEIQDVPQD